MGNINFAIMWKRLKILYPKLLHNFHKNVLQAFSILYILCLHTYCFYKHKNNNYVHKKRSNNKLTIFEGYKVHIYSKRRVFFYFLLIVLNLKNKNKEGEKGEI